MKKRIPLLIAGSAVLAMVVFFANIFVTYAHPMKNESINLSPVVMLDEVTAKDRSTELGWSIYIMENDVITPLEYDRGCYSGLQYLGQTFYYARVMTEELDAASLSLDSVNRNYSVFLDGVLIYTDCPEQDNRIGYLTLPAREWERTEKIIISLPEGYVGKTLTIAQSTPPYAETAYMATHVMPSAVTLYCSYAYESALIAESFQTAYVSALAYAVGVLLLFFFLRQTAQGSLDAGLLLLALTFFLSMTAQMYNTSYHYRYFGTPNVTNTDLFCRWLTQAALLFFLTTKARRIRAAAWTISIVSALCTALHIILMIFNNVSQSSLQRLFFHMHSNFSFILPLVMLLLFFLEHKEEDIFRRWFAPAGCLCVILCTHWQLLSSGRAAFLSILHDAVTNLYAEALAWPLTLLLLAMSLILTLIGIIRDEINAHTEKHLVKEMMLMAQQRYENLRCYNEEVMMLRHDMTRHYRLLRQTTTDEKTAAYLDELLDKNDKIRPVIQSGNDMLDIILGSRLSAAIDVGVKVDILRAEAPASLPLSDADLCSLVMNLMDNAIAAAKAAASPSISLDLHCKSSFFVFMCENTMPSAPSVTATEKTVPQHGLGLKIVRQIAERYGHLLTIEDSGATYKVSLAMPLSHSTR